MKGGRIDSTADFTPRGLGQLKAWLQPWFTTGPQLPPFATPALMARAIAAAVHDPANAEIAALEVLEEAEAHARRNSELVALASRVGD